MMKHRISTSWWVSLAALAVVATSAQAAKPTLTHEQKKAMSASVAKNQHNFKQPRTEAEARPSYLVRADGSSGMLVPENLWSHLSVQDDAAGVRRVRETDGSEQAKAAAPEGPAHE